MYPTISPASSLACSLCWRSSSSVSAKHNNEGQRCAIKQVGAVACPSPMENSLMPEVSSHPDITAPAEPTGVTTRAGQIKARLPHIGNLVRQQGALIALVVVVAFSFIRYDNFNTITIYSVLNFNAQFGLIALGMTFV